VVSTSQTCRYLHHLAFDKTVWLGLLHNLRRRSILDQTCTPNIEILSTDELIKLVKRLLTGPETWSPRDADSFAQISREITLHPTVHTGPGILDWENMAKLLPSGRYVLFKNWLDLECWNVAADRLLWKHISAIEHASVLDFAAEENAVEDSVIIVVCVRTYPHVHGDRKNYLEMVRVDLQTGTPNTLLIARAPDSRYENPFSAPIIRGPLVAVGTNSQRDRHMILNWRAKSYFILQCTVESRIALIERHIVLKISSRHGQGQIHVIANHALRAYWSPTIPDGGPVEFAAVSAEDIPKLSIFVDTEASQSFSHISVVPSPLQDDNYRVWIQGSIHGSGRNDGLLCYQLFIPAIGQPQWRRRIQARKPTPSPYHPVPYSGHTLHRSTVLSYKIYPPISPYDYVQVNLPFAAKYVDVAPYSGTLTYSTPTSIVIQYYK